MKKYIKIDAIRYSYFLLHIFVLVDIYYLNEHTNVHNVQYLPFTIISIHTYYDIFLSSFVYFSFVSLLYTQTILLFNVLFAIKWQDIICITAYTLCIFVLQFISNLFLNQLNIQSFILYKLFYLQYILNV